VKFQNIDQLLEVLKELCDDCLNIYGEQTKKGKLLKDVLGRNQLLDYNQISELAYISQKPSDEDDIDERMNGIIKIFKYLQSGKIIKSDKTINGAIYPYVGTFEYATRNRDGYSIAHFSVATDEGICDIKVLSEFKYKINEKYYCFPNIIRSSEDLWIEPIIISYKNFEINLVNDGEMADAKLSI